MHHDPCAPESKPPQSSNTCVAGSYEPLTSRNSLTHRGSSLGRSRLHMCIRVAIVRGAAPLSHSFSALVSGQASHRGPFVPSKPPLQAPGLHLLCAFMPSILRFVALRRLFAKFPSSQKLANGERNLQTNSIATRKRTWVVPRYPRAHYSIRPVNREGYAVHERRENACLTRAILLCYKVLALYQL